MLFGGLRNHPPARALYGTSPARREGLNWSSVYRHRRGIRNVDAVAMRLLEDRARTSPAWWNPGFVSRHRVKPVRCHVDRSAGAALPLGAADASSLASKSRRKIRRSPRATARGSKLELDGRPSPWVARAPRAPVIELWARQEELQYASLLEMPK